MRAGAFCKFMLASAVMVLLAACGGGDGRGMSFIPAPPATPAPAPAPAPAAAGNVVIFRQPPVGQFASTGVWTNLYSATLSENGRFTGIESQATAQPSIRYTADGLYEVKLPGEDYLKLAHSPAIANPPPDDPFLILQPDLSRKFTLDHSQSGFRYSAMGTWSRPDLDFGFTTDSGILAFGVPTASGSVPLAGTATYEGVVAGLTDAKFLDAPTNSWSLRPAGGSVTLNFGFANGSLGGEMSLFVNGDFDPINVGRFAFTQTVFSRGSTGYSGSFATNLQGFNFFSGSFTGPNADETIGSWAVPFQMNGESHQAIGAWMARHQ